MLFDILDTVDTVLRVGVVQGGYQAMSAWAAGPIRSGVILYVTMQGYSLMKGQTQGLSLADFGWRVVKIAVIMELCLHWDQFNDTVVQIVWGTYAGLANTMSGLLITAAGNSTIGGVASVLPMVGGSMSGLDNNMLDQAFMSQIGAALSQLFSPPSIFWFQLPISIPFTAGAISFDIPIPLPNLLPNLAGLIALIMTIILFASVFVVLLFSRIGLISCLAVAPIFIALALFEQTRSYTDSWFRGLLGFVLTPLLLVVVLVIASATLGVVQYNTSGSLIDLFMPIIAYALLCYALAKSVASVPQFASGLVGSMLAHLGSDAALGVIGRIQAPIGMAAGAAKGMVTGGPKGAAMGAAQAGAKAASK